MTTGSQNSDAQLLLGGAAAIFMLSCIWTVVRPADHRGRQPGQESFSPSGPVYRPEKWPRPAATSRVWPDPPGQESGPGWDYEVFTPPRVYYNSSTAEFSVGAPPTAGEEPSRLDGELLAVKPELYRLQLMGYVGGPGDYRAVFVRPGLPGTLLLREGQAIPDLGLTLLSLVVNPHAGGAAGGAPVEVMLHDARSGEKIMLDSRTLRPTGSRLAVLRSAGERRAREWREGDDWTAGTVTYRIESIQLDPPLVILTRPGGAPSRPERKLLSPSQSGAHPDRKLAPARGIVPESTTTGLAADHE